MNTSDAIANALQTQDLLSSLHHRSGKAYVCLVLCTTAIHAVGYVSKGLSQGSTSSTTVFMVPSRNIGAEIAHESFGCREVIW